MMHWQTYQQSSGSPLLSGHLVRCRLKKPSSLTSLFVVLVFALKCAPVKSVCVRDVMDVVFSFVLLLLYAFRDV